jgi:hypothetical protein
MIGVFWSNHEYPKFKSTMVRWFSPPPVENTIAILSLILNIVFPGAGNLVVGLSSNPQDKDSITTGIVIIVLNLVIPVVLYVVISFLAVITFGLASLFIPFVFILNIIAWIYGIIWVRFYFYLIFKVSQSNSSFFWKWTIRFRKSSLCCKCSSTTTTTILWYNNTTTTTTNDATKSI